MSDLLSWKMNRDDPMANFAAGMRWSTLWGIGYNVAPGLLTGSEVNAMLSSAWFGAYVLITQWLSRITDREGEIRERWQNEIAAWAKGRGDRASGRRTHDLSPTSTTESTT